MPESVGSTKCLAISFSKQSQAPSCSMNIFDLFMSFKYINITGQRNPWLSQAVQNCYLLGHFEPYVLLVGGSDYYLQVLKLSWMRTQLKSPFGFVIESISDAGGLLMQRVPQYRAMRLEEVVCQLIWQNTQYEASCSMETLMASLQRVYHDLQMRQPSVGAIRMALNTLLNAGAVYFSGHGYSLLTADKLAVAKWLENVPEDVSLDGDDDADLPATCKVAPLADAEPTHGLPSDDYVTTPCVKSPAAAPLDCQPYASSPVAPPVRTADTHSRQPGYDAMMSHRNTQTFRSPSVSPTDLPRRATCKADTWTATAYTSHPTLQPRQSTTFIVTPMERPICMQPPSSAAIRAAPTLRPDRTNGHRRPDVLSPGAARPSRPDSSSMHVSQRAISADPLQHHPRKDETNDRLTPTKVPQPSFIKWIVDQFRRLRRPRCRSTETKERLLNSKSQMSECRQQGPDHLAQSHQKSYSIAVPDHQAIRARKSTSSTQNIAPELRLPAPTLSTKQKLSDFGSLRRCFSLAEDASHEQGLVNGDTPVSKVFPPFRPNAASGPSEGCVKTSNPPMSVPQSVNFSNRPRWISHLDLFGSPSCSSLIVNPPFRVDRSPLQPLGPPSQSGSRLALHGPSADRTTDWHYTNHARQSSLCTPSHMTLHLRKRPATRDSGFVESDSVHPQTQPPDRSAGYSISPLSRSSDGARSFFATDTTSMAMPAVIPQTSYVWWTTGFQHAVPQGFTPGPISRCSGYQPTSGLMEYSIR